VSLFCQNTVDHRLLTSLPTAGAHVGLCAVDMVGTNLRTELAELATDHHLLYGKMAPIPLLPLHKSMLANMHSTQTSDLLILARGLGLRTVVCNLLQLYDSPKSLVLLMNASPAEEAGLRDELGVMGCRNPGLRVVTFEMGSKDR
jgi:hypothetical protein